MRAGFNVVKFAPGPPASRVPVGFFGSARPDIGSPHGRPSAAGFCPEIRALA